MNYDEDNYNFTDFYTYNVYEPTEQDLDNIKQKTFHKLTQSEIRKAEKRKIITHFSRVAAAFLIIIALFLASSEDLRASLFRIFTGVHIMNEQINEVINEDVVNDVVIEDPGGSYKAKSSKTDQIIDSAIVNADSIEYIPLSSITNLTVEKNFNTYKIPEFVFDHFDMALFVKESDMGWRLKKGDALTVDFEIDSTVTGTNQEGENIIYGYILDGDFTEMTTSKSIVHQVTINAEREGIYYPCVINSALGYIKVINGSISIKH